MEDRKIIIYQIFTRLFGNRSFKNKENGTLAENGCGKLNFFDDTVLWRIKKLGVSHIWYTGIIRHASTTDYSAYGIPHQHPAVVKGKAGSPYAIADYYDIDPDLAEDVDNRMAEFEALVRRTHSKGLKIIIDFVPNHVARQYKSVKKPTDIEDLGETDDTNLGFSPKNNFYYCPKTPFEPQLDMMHGETMPYKEYPAKATGNDCFNSHPNVNDWYETVKLNYGIDYCDASGRSYHYNPIPSTWRKMRDILLFWTAKGVDGFRCDMAEMVPPEFWHWCISEIKAAYPAVNFIGEVYNPSLYRTYLWAGFDYLYDKVGMYDCLCRVIRGESAASEISYQWQCVDDIKEHLLYFLENHDELRLASDFLAGNGRKAMPAVIVSVLMNTNPFMLYAGQEFGEHGMDKEGFSGRDGRTTIFDYWTVTSLFHGYVNRRKLSAEEREMETFYIKMLNIAAKEAAVSKGVFFDLMYANPYSENFNPYHQYAFLRKSEKEVLLIIANFSNERKWCRVNIPQHAFSFLGMAEQEVKAKDLLTGEQRLITLHHDRPVEVTVEAYGGRIYKFLTA